MVITETADESSWVLACQNGDPSAFEKLVRQTGRLVYSRIYLHTGDPHRTEDLVQETFLIAWRSIGQVTDPHGFRTWLLSIAKTVTVDALRHDTRKKRSARGRQSDLQDVAQRLADEGTPAPPLAIEQEESRANVRKLLAALPEEYSLPLTLRYIAGADYEAIGKQLGLTNGSLRGLLNRGMTRLREMMNEPTPGSRQLLRTGPGEHKSVKVPPISGS